MNIQPMPKTEDKPKVIWDSYLQKWVTTPTESQQAVDLINALNGK